MTWAFRNSRTEADDGKEDNSREDQQDGKHDEAASIPLIPVYESQKSQFLAMYVGPDSPGNTSLIG